jgi:glutamine amidotransferase
MVVIASERISDEPGWEEVKPGELIHVGPDLKVDRETVVSGPPAHPMRLSAEAQESQSYL